MNTVKSFVKILYTAKKIVGLNTAHLCLLQFLLKNS
jgi:hypothetical protein